MEIEAINPIGCKRQDIEAFLSKFNLSLDNDVEYTITAKLEDNIIGTCSCAGRVVKCFAVDEKFQGEGIAAALMTHMTNYLFDRGVYETFIFTKPKNSAIFEGLGCREVYSADSVMLLESGTANVKRYVKNMFDRSGLSNGKKAALIMNCNPFTLGHRYLIEKAARENNEAVVFIVEEDRSLFPFDIRLELARKGTDDLKNVTVLPGGSYIISQSTFPTYFLKQEDERLEAYTKLDAGIFGKYIAPAFNIERRYVGTEPYCAVTNKYNEALKEVLPTFGIDVVLVNRFEIDNRAVSASRVREIIGEGNIDDIKKLVPYSTYEFLTTGRGMEIVDKIKSICKIKAH